MKRPSNIAILVLFVRTAIRRYVNRSAMMSRRLKLSAIFSRSGKASDASGSAARDATRHRDDKRSRGHRWLEKAIPAAMLFTFILMGYFAAANAIDAYRLQEMQSNGKIRIWPEDYGRLQKAAAAGESKLQDLELDSIFSTLLGTEGSWLAKAAKETAANRFHDVGLDGFEPIHTDGPWSGPLAALEPAGRLEALKSLGVFFLILNLAAVSFCIGMSKKSLTGDGPDLIWLFQFPVSRGVLLAAKLLEYVFEFPMILIANAVLSAIFFGMCGGSFFESIGLAIALSFSAAITIGAIRLAVEAWLTQKCGRNFRSIVISLAAVIGSFGALILAVSGNSQPVMNLFLAASKLIPDEVLANPFSVGFGPQLVDGIGGFAWLIPLAMAAFVSCAAVWFARRLTATGLAGQQSSDRRENAVARTASGRTIFRGLVLKELLQMHRRPGYVIQILFAPAMIFGVLYLQGNPLATSLASASGGGLCVGIFSGMIYMLLLAATQTLATELKTLWFLQCQPRSLADAIRTKSRVWGTIATTFALAIALGAAAFRPTDRWEILERTPALVAGVWLMSDVIFGSLALGATIMNETRIRFRSNAIVWPFLIGSDVALAIFTGNAWNQLTIVVMLVMLGIALRQKQQSELAWLSEPAENPPQQLYLLHGLTAVVGFLLIRDIVSGVLMNSGLDAIAIMTIAYCASSVLVLAFVSSWLRRNQLTILPTLRPNAVWRPLLVGTAAACGVAVVCVLMLHKIIPTAGSAFVIWDAAAGTANCSSIVFAGMVVIVAPLFEELVFRGLLYQSLRRSKGVMASVALTTLLFVSIHPILSCIGVAALGITTAMVAERTKRLWPSMLVHIAYNATVVAVFNMSA